LLLVSLYFFEPFGFCRCCFSKINKIYEIYEKGYKQLEKELNISKILRNLRNLRIHSKMIGFNKAKKLKIKNQDKNLIELTKFK
jgi:hypothetical protein